MVVLMVIYSFMSQGTLKIIRMFGDACLRAKSIHVWRLFCCINHVDFQYRFDESRHVSLAFFQGHVLRVISECMFRTTPFEQVWALSGYTSCYAAYMVDTNEYMLPGQQYMTKNRGHVKIEPIHVCAQFSTCLCEVWYMTMVNEQLYGIEVILL